MLWHLYEKTSWVYTEVYNLMAARCLNIDSYYNINITRGLLPDTIWWYFIYFTARRKKYGISESHKGTADVGKIFFTLIPTTARFMIFLELAQMNVFPTAGSKLSAFFFATYIWERAEFSFRNGKGIK